MLLILCASIFLNRTLSLNGLNELVLCIVHVCPLSALPYFSFYGGTCSFAPIIFECKKKKTRPLRSWCADNIFIPYHYPVSRSRNSNLATRSSLLSRSCLLTDTRGSFLISRWLMLADRLLFCISRHLLAAFRLLFFTRWSAGRCRALAPCWSLLVTRFSWHFKLLACRCPLIAVGYLGSRLFLF